ncbi:MAG: T9SS type A sorting domain-containing protein [Bacteroidetes bacterium]|nr:T9SS type A sorting domain-containing protein [Bacteroidota bacterium]
MKFFIFTFCSLLITRSLAAQHNDSLLFKDSIRHPYYSQPHMYEHNDQIFLELLDSNDCTFHIYNLKNKTLSDLNVPSGFQRSYYNSAFHTYQDKAYYAATLRNGPKVDIYVFEIDSTHVTNFILPNRQFYKSSSGNNNLFLYDQYYELSIFNFKSKSFKKADSLSYIDAVSEQNDTVIAFDRGDVSKIYGIDQHGNKWVIDSFNSREYIQFWPNNEIYNTSSNYFYYAVEDNAIYRTNKKKSNSTKLIDLKPGTWLRPKRSKNGIIFYGNAGIYLLRDHSNSTIQIADSFDYPYGATFFINDRVFAYSYNGDLTVYNLDTRKSKTTQIGVEGSLVKGFARNTAKDEVYLSVISELKADTPMANIIKVDAKGRVFKMNRKPFNTWKEGTIDNILHINDKIYYCLYNYPKYSVHLLSDINETRLIPVTFKVFLDNNRNGKMDSSEHYYANLTVHDSIDNTTYYSGRSNSLNISKYSGAQKFKVIPEHQLTYSTDTVIDFNLDTSISDTTIYVGIIPDPNHLDIDCHTHFNRIRCSNKSKIKMSLQNSSFQKISGTISIKLDSAATKPVFSVAPDSSFKTQHFWKLDSLNINDLQTLKIVFNTPDFTRMGDFLHFKSIYEGYSQRNDTIRELFNDSVVVSCSYDPNDKAVWPNRINQEFKTLFNEPLKYRIRFQNTGNDTAYDVSITDTLSPLLDWSSIKLLDYSHPMLLKQEDFGVLEFIFKNINLPDSNTDTEGSQGYVYFQVNAKNSVKERDLIKNTAHIFFDQNPPITTNTTLNLMVSKLDVTVNHELPNAEDFYIYPNPAENTVNIQLKNEGLTNVEIYDMNGSLLYQAQHSETNIQVPFDENAPGMYLLRIEQNDIIQTAKISKR